ncbi:MAG: TIGR02757 family protein [Bacteroidetes bacterium]|nr:MAG: TIGR02757 family protein [Bacteroidota bacterium]
MPNTSEIKEFLEEKHDLYNQVSFIDSDPIQIPHLFSRKEDIEIAGFLTSSIAWGNRKMIIRNARKIIAFMQNNPYEFLLNENICLSDVQNIGHRTFKPEDFLFFLQSLKNIYENHGGLEDVFTKGYKNENSVFSAITYFRNIFFELPHLQRTEKHIANVMKNSAAKRINMFLMWMVRKDNRGVHFGLWDKISPADLIIPLDIHTGNTARSLELLTRKQNDRKAAEELTNNLKKFEPEDPVKYDFALFGLGVFEGFRRT